jgi:hypothetical protein
MMRNLFALVGMSFMVNAAEYDLEAALRESLMMYEAQHDLCQQIADMSLALHHLQAEKDALLMDPYERIQVALASTPVAQLTDFKTISQFLRGIAQHQDVHILDNFVFGAPGNIGTLLDIGRQLNLDNPGLTWPEIQTQIGVLVSHLPVAQGNVTHYEGAPITAPQLAGYIQTYFSNLPNELNGFFRGSFRCDQVRELWSRLVGLATLLHPTCPHVLPLVAQTIAENYMTQGGCVQGQVNRSFVLYTSLLGSAGLDSLIQQ